MAFTSLALDQTADLGFGVAALPVTTRRGLVIGGGCVYPELNFTLGDVAVDEATMPEVRRQYRQMIDDALRRAVALEVPGLVVEFETLPPMTQTPRWGNEITAILAEALEQAHARHGLVSALRVTPNDTREFERPARMRHGPMWEAMLEAFDGAAANGGELLSIESVGGKEVHDDALMAGDLPAAIFALCILGVRDMRFLWTEVSQVAASRGVIAAGDTACGFANTAMVLAEQGLVPRSFAAVIRAVSAVRSLVAYECGAVGPGKDCGYENAFLKAITGMPMAGEGKTAACAHASPLGNIAAATCDLWSNESVQNVKLLGGMAPTCCLEQLIYDCRLMNRALQAGPQGAAMLRDWLVESDSGLDPQAYILCPDNIIAISKAIAAAPDHYRAGVAAATEAIAQLRRGHEAGAVSIPEREQPWLDRMARSVESLPQDEQTFVVRMMEEVDTTRFLPAEYGL